jgi:hypothetical protein
MALPVVNVTLGSVANPTYVNAVVLDPDNPLPVDPNGILNLSIENTRLHEVYAGSIILQASNHSGSIARAIYKSFLPIEPSVLRFYGPASVEKPTINVAVCVSPGGFADDDDEANTVSVDEATAALELETLPGQQPGFCLILKAQIAILSGDFHRIAYNVTVLGDNLNRREEHEFPDGTKPQ